MNETSLTAELVVPFSCPEHAHIAYETLAVDSEPRRDLIKKKLELRDNLVCVSWQASESRILRVSINSFLDNLQLILETIQLFD
jgi:EKC/KEOPS complex subunit PCC1/LAGE3